MTFDEIKELLELFKASGIGEMELERADSRLRLKQAVSSEIMAIAPQAYPMPMPAAPAGAPPPAAPAPASSDDSTQTVVKSPIVGTFYESPSPDAPAFVRVGDQVEKGQVLCIIESMKLMNEIESDTAGTIVSKLVENGKPVEYGQPLFAVRPR